MTYDLFYWNYKFFIRGFYSNNDAFLQRDLCTQLPGSNLTLAECHALQMEEIETLQAIIEDKNVIVLNEDSTSFVIRVYEEIKDDDVIKIRFRLVKQ